MPRSNSITMNLPPFVGTIRILVIVNVAVFFLMAVLPHISLAFATRLADLLLLQPSSVIHGEIWQLVTYSFFHFGILEILFAMLTVWVCGTMLEGAYGVRWVRDLYFSSAIGGAVIASVLSFSNLLSLHPTAHGHGAWAGAFGLLIAIGMRFGEQEFLFLFVIRMKAKYMVAIYILIAVAMLLLEADAFGALLQLAGAFSGYLYVRYAPRRGLAFGVSEQVFGLRNSYYRYKRRRAARKFEVYMGKQGRNVKFDADGRYIDPDERKDPNDKRWMN